MKLDNLIADLMKLRAEHGNPNVYAEGFGMPTASIVEAGDNLDFIKHGIKYVVIGARMGSAALTGNEV